MPNFQADLGMLARVFNQAPTVKAETPADWQEQADRSAARQAEVQTRRAAAEKAEAERAAQARIRALAQKHKGDPDAMQADLMQEDPVFGVEFGKMLGDYRKSGWEALTKQNEAERAADARDVAEVEAAGEDPVAYAAARARVLQRDPEKAALLPDQYDPAKVGNFYKVALTVDQIRQQRQHSIDMGVKGEWAASLSAALDDPEIDTPEEHATVLEAQRKLGAPPHILAQFKTFDPNPETRTARLRMLGLTPAQRATAEKEGALVQVDGPNGAVWATRDQAVGKPVGRAPASEGALVKVVGPGGKVTWMSREDAEGKAAPMPASGSAGGGDSDIADLADAYVNGDKAAATGLGGKELTKFKAEVLRRGGTLPTAATGDGKPPSGIERKETDFFNRMKAADENLQAVEGEIAKLGGIAKLRLATGSGWFQTPLMQRYQQARQAFTEAYLRRDSGAAIAEHEYTSADRQFFVQPSDEPGTIAQKQGTRATNLWGTAKRSGRGLAEFYGDDEAALLLEGYKARAGGKAAPSAAAALPPAVKSTDHSRTVPVDVDVVRDPVTGKLKVRQ